MNAPQLAPPRLEDVVRKIQGISTLPHIALKIIKITSDTNSSASDLEDVIKSDPGLTAKLLKMVNSAHFGLSEKVMEIRKAIVFMGFKSVRDVALSASVCELFKQDTPIGHYTRSGLWKHSVGVAVTANVIAQRTEFDVGDFVFSTAIMHDIGIVMLDQYLHKHFTVCMQNPDCRDKGLHNVEEEVMGFTHQDLAREVVKGWGLPEEFIETCSYHHRPEMAPESCQVINSIIYMANTLCDARRFGFTESSEILTREFNFALHKLNFTKTDVSVILEELPAELEKANDLINLVDHS